MGFMSEPFELFPTKPQRSFALYANGNYYYFEKYLTVGEDSNDSIEITQHPVQQGATISDHAYIKPTELKIKIIVGEVDRPLSESYTMLLNFQSTRQPITIITAKRSYYNMLIKSLDVSTDKYTENILSVGISFQEVIMVPVTPSVVPKRSKQKGGDTNKVEKAGKKSLLKVLLGPIIGG